MRPSEPACGTCSSDVGVADPRFVGCRHAQASVVLRKAVQIIVMSVMVVISLYLWGLLHDGELPVYLGTVIPSSWLSALRKPVRQATFSLP